MDRREFLKVAGITTAATGAVLATKPKEALAIDLGKEHDTFPLKVTNDFRGFNNKDIIFLRMYWDNSELEDYIADNFGYRTMLEMVMGRGPKGGPPQEGEKPQEDKIKIPGNTAVDKALKTAAWSVCNTFAPNSANGIRDSKLMVHPIDPKTGKVMKDMPVKVPGMHSWDNSSVNQRNTRGGAHQFKSPEEAAKYVKKASKMLGADLVGIAPYNESTKRWTYTQWTDLNYKEFTMPDGSKEYMPFDMERMKEGLPPGLGVKDIKSDFMKEAGFEPKSVIVLAYEMDYDAMKAAPTAVSGAAVGMGYSQMSENVFKIAQFLRNMGYKAIPCGNDTSLSVPLAIEAGLGEGSRMGLLVTEKFGPRVRLAKVYTDLEIKPDKPITFGVKEFCNVCMKCADACPSKAICHEPAQVIKEGVEFSSGKANASTMVGVEKFFVNAERCFAFWQQSGTDCATCISVCPYNKIDEWHHDLSKIMTLTPFKPLLRSLDEWFGYGGPIEPNERMQSKYLKDAVDDFWNKV